MEMNGSKKSIDVGIDCQHPELDVGYGFGTSSGWRGIGGYRYCTTCYHVVEFYDDTESMFPEEIEHNKKKREGLI